MKGEKSKIIRKVKLVFEKKNFFIGGQCLS